MLIVQLIIIATETIWLATIYGHRAFGAFDQAQARLNEILEDDYYHVRSIVEGQ